VVERVFAEQTLTACRTEHSPVAASRAATSFDNQWLEPIHLVDVVGEISKMTNAIKHDPGGLQVFSPAYPPGYLGPNDFTLLFRETQPPFRHFPQFVHVPASVHNSRVGVDFEVQQYMADFVRNRVAQNQ